MSETPEVLQVSSVRLRKRMFIDFAVEGRTFLRLNSEL